MPEKIEFEGDFNSADFNKSVDGMIGSLKKAQEQGNSLNASLESTQEILDGTTDGIKTLTAQIAGLDKSSKDYAATNTQLTNRLKALQDQQAKYSTTLVAQQKDLAGNQAAVTKLETAYKNTATAATNLQTITKKPIAPSINDGQIVTQIAKMRDVLGKNINDIIKPIDSLKEKSKEVGSTLAKSLNTATPAIESVSDKVSELGGAFGVVGIAAGVGLGFLIKKLYELATAESEAEKAQKLLDSTFAAAGDAYAKSIADVSRLREEINLAKQGFLDKDHVIKDYNESIGKTTGLVKSLDEAEQALNKNAEAYIKFTFLKAVANEANSSSAKKTVEAELAQLKPGTEFVTQGEAFGQALVQAFVHPLNNTSELLEGAGKRLEKSANKNKKEIVDAANKDSKTLSEIAKKYEDEAAALAKKFNFNPFGDTKPPKDTADKSRKEIENVYEQELQKLKADIAKLDEKGFTDEASITKAVEEDFKKRSLAFDKAFKNKQLTAPQLASLKSLLKQEQELILKDALKDFHEKRAEYLSKLENEITNIQSEDALKRISNIQDDFQRQKETILSETDKLIEAKEQSRDKIIADAQKSKILKPAEIQDAITKVNEATDQFITDVHLHANQQLQKLSFDTFEKLRDEASKRLSDTGNLGISQGTLIDVQKQAQLYTEGKISYKQFQDAITEINRIAVNGRFALEKTRLEDLIKIDEKRLATDKTLTAVQIKALQDEIVALKKALAEATTSNVESNVADDNAAAVKRVEDIKKFASAIGEVAQSIISFWQQANDAEQKALDRSISIQTTRVAQAQIIAEHGNSEYLRLEEERQQQLNIQQENAARRTIAINAALQTSQLLVAVTGAIAKIAQPGVGTVEVIASIGTILGALASGYAIVKSLQQNQPSLFVGTEDTGPGGNVDRKGGFHAVIHPHERILTAEQNKHFKGISNDQLVETVKASKILIENYASPKLPELNIAAMEMATQVSATENIRLAAFLEDNNRELKENNALQKKILLTLKNMGFSVNVDRKGMAISVAQAVEEIEKNKRK